MKVRIASAPAIQYYAVGQMQVIVKSNEKRLAISIMDPRVIKLKTPQECETFAKNARNLGAPQLADEARQRAVQLRAEAHGATSDVERQCLEAVYAYEEVLSAQKGKKVRANRTWPMIDEYGVIPAVERIVMRSQESVGFTALAEMGLKDFAFEAVILRHPEQFTAKAVARSRERLAENVNG